MGHSNEINKYCKKYINISLISTPVGYLIVCLVYPSVSGRVLGVVPFV